MPLPAPPDSAARDHERLAAEERYRTAARRRAGPENPLPPELDAYLAGLSDDELRLALFRIERAPAGPVLSIQARRTLQALQERVPAPAGLLAAAQDDEEQWLELLDQHFGVSIAEDGLIEIARVTEAVKALVGDLPVALFHHTSTALLPAIAERGLIVGQQTNFFNTQQGVYLSTIRAGEPVSVYSRRAARVHGGEPTTVRVRRRLAELVPDPDDADLDWAQGRQFISTPVPAHDVLLEPYQAEVLAMPEGAEPSDRYV